VTGTAAASEDMEAEAQEAGTQPMAAPRGTVSTRTRKSLVDVVLYVFNFIIIFIFNNFIFNPLANINCYCLHMFFGL
jgi:hypothetical protein